jgi:RecA/RadA recombinase
MYSGQPHSGKTTAAVVEMAAFQRANPEKTCVYVDVEHSLDLQFQAKMTGLDLNRMYYMNPAHLSGEQILDAIIDMQKDAEDIGMIVLDSIPALLPADVLENDISKDVGMRGTIAKPLHKFLIEMSSLLSKKENILILINQVRQVGTTFTGAPIYKEPGGDGPRYYSSVSVRFGTRTFTQGENMDACKPDGEGADGYRIRFKITKNKTAPCNRGGGFITFRYDTGLDWIHDLLEIAIQFNFIQRLNNITYQLIDLETGEILTNEEGKELKGKKSDLIEYIKNNIAFQTKYLDMLTKYISADNVSYGSLLDERTIKEIDAEETSITA